MQKRYLGIAALAAAFATQPTAAQKPLNIEVGAFGQFSVHDKDLNIDNGPTIGGRLAIYLIKSFAVELDGQLGKTDWDNAGTIKSLTFRPWSVRLLFPIKITDKTRFILGAGYQQNQYIGREIEVVPGTFSRNEYEDAITGLVGLKICMNDKWGFRFDGVTDYNPSPNFTGDASLNGTALNFGLRAGIGTMLYGSCPGEPSTWTLGLTPASSRHRVGETEQLTITALDGKGAAIALTRVRDYRCSSDNPNVATVDQNGRVTAVGPGTATITCSGMMFGIAQSATHTITVRRPDWRLTVSGGGTHMVGQGGQASASAADEDNRAVTGTTVWTSSNPSVATVDNNGNYRCVAAGSATITATMTRADETRTGTAQVTCTAPPPPPPPARLVANLTDVHFGFNRSDLTRVGRDTLDWVIRQMQSGEGASWMISVEGHTDPYGSDSYNERLSRARARTVVAYLTRRGRGVDASRIAGENGFGETCLLVDDDHTSPQKSKAEHGRNRRVEIWNLNGTAVPTGCRPMSDYQNR
ncbi:MAG: Ig-like domain-containing protein [Gemmatimonadaceae bacterium]